MPRLIAVLLTMVFAVVLFRTAWMSDDALITLRTVLNVTNGFGLTYNIAERVQTFTHPLWLGLLTLAYLVSGNIYYGTFALGMLCSGAAFWLAIRHASTTVQSAVIAIVLLWSRAFVDFSTSGLENPLSYLLLAFFVALFLDERREPRRWLAGLCLLTSLLYLTRPDDVLLVLPLLGVAAWRVRRPAAVAVALLAGLVPAILWTVFALVYYGFPFPNTAYAKLAMGINGGELRTQGFLYLLDSLDRDPLTLTAIAFALLLTFAAKHPRPSYVTAARALAAGVLLYLLYVVSIGGDFMAGRFMAVPLFGAALLMGRLVSLPRGLWAGAAGILLVVGTTSMHVPLWSNSRFDDSAAKMNGIVDERGIYFRNQGLVTAKRATFRNPNWPRSDWEAPPLRVLDTCGGMGAGGIEQGPYAHLLDECALADPLLARLPALFNTQWRSGHYRRMIPAGYRESLETGSNQLQDPRLREYYEHLRRIIRSDDLLSAERIRTIMRMNRGAYDRLIDRPFYRHGGFRVSLADVATVREDGIPWNEPGNRVLDKPLAVAVEDQRGRRYFDISLDSDDQYELTFLKNGAIVDTVSLGPIPEYRRKPGLASYTENVPAGARAKGFDAIIVAPAKGGDYAMGHLLLEGFHDTTDAVLQRRVTIRDGRTAQ
jgi:arabinofuranosyltransferase